MVVFCFTCGTPCKTHKGLENHVKSRPKCLDDLGIARAASLGISSSVSSSQPMNHHSFGFETDPKLAAKRPVEVMWRDDTSLEAASSMPDSPSKLRKGSSSASVLRTGGNSAVSIEHRCGTKKIDMVLDENDASRPLQELLVNKLPADKASAPSLCLFQIQRIQSLMASGIDDFSSDDESCISGDGLDFMEAPPLVDDDLPNNDVDVQEEERMFEQAKMYTDRGNGCFTNEEILSIRLLGIMRDIGAPLKTYGRIVALFKDVITEREAITTTFRHRHTAINHFSRRFCMKGLYPTVLTQPSPLNNRFYPVPVHNAQAMIESLLYSSLAKDDNNLLFPNPDDPFAPLPPYVKTLLTSTLVMSTGTRTRIYAPAPTKSSVELSATLTN